MTPRIPQTFIQDVLARTDIITIVQLRISIKKRGNHYTGLCPFHQEKTPSFSVSAEKQFYYCFGCGAYGNAIGFLMAFDRLSFLDALQQLAGQLGLSLPLAKETEQNADAREAYHLLANVAQFYQDQLRHSPKAINYLKGRAITGQTAKRFAIGYAPLGWENLQSFYAEREKLLAQGLLIQKESNRYFSRFRDRIMFPIRDIQGRVIAFGGRTLGSDTPKYMNSPETTIFHKSDELYGLYETGQRHKKIKQLLVVEGYMDVVSLHQQQIDYAVGTLGTAINSRHLHKLLRFSQDIVFCFDGDDAGRRAAWRALTTSLPLMNDGVHIRFLFLPEKEDPDSWVQKIGAAAFEKHLSKALPLSTVFFDHLAEEIPIRSIDDKAHFAKKADDYLQMMPPGLFREFLLKALAERLGTDIEGLTRQLTAPVKTGIASRQQKRGQRTMLSPANLAIALLLQHPHVAANIKDISDITLADTHELSLLKRVLDFLHQYPNSHAGSLLELWPNKTEQPQLAALMAHPLPALTADEFAVEFQGALERLREHQREALMNLLINKAKHEALSEAEKETLQKLLRKSRDIPI